MILLEGRDQCGVLLTVAYVGTDFHGFAMQPRDRTVAGELQGAISDLDPSVRKLRGVSRTDAGVHACGQLVAFDTARAIPPKGWVLGLARHLPDSVAARRARVVPAGFEPRRHVRRKWYRYTVLQDRRRDPFVMATSWRIADPLNLDRARAEAKPLVGAHDFAAFRSSSDERTSTERSIEAVTVERAAWDRRLVHIDVVGDGFLHNMVRIIVGTLVEVARGRLPPGRVERGLRSGDRTVLGITAPAQGLCLQQVDLDCDLDGEVWPDAGPEPEEGAKLPSVR